MGRTPEERARRRKAFIIAGTVALVIVALIIGTILYARHQSAVRQEQAEQARIADEQAQRDAIATTGRTFLEAIAHSDAQAALKLLPGPSQDHAELLTNEVLADSAKRAPLTDIQVSDPQLDGPRPGVGHVKASFKLGDKTVSQDFQLERFSGPDWKLQTSTLPNLSIPSGSTLMVNGVKITGGYYPVLFGSYAATSTNPLIQLDGDPVLVTSRLDDNQMLSRSSLTPDGLNQVNDAARGLLNGCLQKKELAPADCPFIRFQEENGVKVDQKTIKYSLKGDPLANARWSVTTATESATATVPITISIAANATKGNTSGTVAQDASHSARLRVKLAGGRAEASFA